MNIRRAAQQSSDPQDLLASANQTNQALEQQLHACGQHLEMMQQAVVQQTHSFREQEIRMQKSSRHNRPVSSARGSDVGDQPGERSDGCASGPVRRTLQMTPPPQGHMGHCRANGSIVQDGRTEHAPT